MVDESGKPSESPTTESPVAPEPTPDSSPKPIERPAPMEGDWATKADHGPREGRDRSD